jgi:predicted metalloprotease with PDZ domain
MTRPPVTYRIVPSDALGHLFTVTCTVSDPDPAGQCFRLPAWIPGSYLIRDFARHVVSCRAEAGGAPVAVTKADKHTWCCAPSAGPLSLVYEVYAWDLSVRGAHLDTTHAAFNGANVFVLALGHEDRACQVEIEPPPAAYGRSWRVATTLPSAGAEPWGFGAYAAGSYDELLDHPVEAGTFALASFEACGVPHDVAVTGRHRADLTRLAADLRRLCETQVRFFGEPAPFERYLFLVTALGEGYGGLEHRASASLQCRRDDLPKAGDRVVNEDYRRFLGLASHEYFHAWHVKRIRPAAFVPYDLTREVHTGLLWVFEGFTSYYDDLLLLRAGLITPEDYLLVLAQGITRVLRTPGRLRQSLAESSFDAWTKLYRPDENTPNAVVSYYGKGALVALALDLTLRRAGSGERSLDDLMQALWQRFGRSGHGIPEDGVEAVAEEVAGQPLGGFFDRFVRGTEDPPLRDLLQEVGVDLRLRAAESQDDKGGRPASRPEWQARAVLGVQTEPAEGGARLKHVLDGGAARRAGLAAGDVIVAVDGVRATHAGLERALAGFEPGSSVRVHAFRRDELLEVSVSLAEAPQDTCVLTLVEGADEATRRRRDAWLYGRSG